MKIKRYKVYITIIVVIIGNLSCSYKTSKDVLSNVSTVLDSLPLPFDSTLIYASNNCGTIDLNKYKEYSINDFFNDGFTFVCWEEAAFNGDSVAKEVLFSLCDLIGNNVPKFNVIDGYQLNNFMSRTLLLSPKSNKMIPVLMKYSKVNICNYNENDDYLSNQQFGADIYSMIFSRLSNKDYAEELFTKYNKLSSDLTSGIIQKQEVCKLLKQIHSEFQIILGSEYNLGKLNFENSNK